MAKYQLIHGNQYIRNTETGTLIPCVSGNIEYEQYLVWLDDEVNTPDPAETPYQETWDYIRAVRNDLLLRCDWTQLLDCPLTQQQKDDWVSYRQDLRDIPGNYATPQDVVWPTPPS